MNLHDHMNDAVGDVTADTHSLVTGARKRGLGMRRRRQALSTFGVAAAVAAIVGGTLALQHDPTRIDQTVGVAQDPTSSDPAALSGKTVPLTGRATAGALKAAVDEVADGAFSDFTGQDTSQFADLHIDAFARFRLAPEGEGFGVVGVNVQPLSILDDLNCVKGTKECDPVRPAAYTCIDSFMLDCTTEVLANGDTVRTYRDTGKGIRLVAEYLSPQRELRVVASATNGLDLPSDQWDAKRPDAVLTTAQLVTIVSQPWWGFELPAEYDGSDLQGYTQIDSSLGGRPIEPSASPSQG